MKQFIALIFAISGSSLFAGPLNGIINVGPSENYTSISLIASALTQYGIDADVIVKVDPSVTYGAITIQPFANPGNHKVNFQSNSNQTVLVDFNATSTANNFVLKISGAKNITFDNFKFNASATSYQNAVTFETNNSLFPENIEFINCQFAATNGTINDNMITANCNLNNIKFDQCKFTGATYGIKLQAPDFLRNLKITNSSFDHQNNTVIDLSNTRGTIIENNSFGTPNMTSTRGIKITNADSAVVINRNNLKINYNISIQNSNSTTVGKCIVIANNIMAPNYEFALKLSGLTGVGTTYIVNNVLMTAASNDNISLQNNTQKIVIQNNIFQQFSSTQPVYNTDISFSNNNYEIDYNAYFYTSFMKNGNIDFSSWKSTYGFDVHSIDDKNNSFLSEWGMVDKPACKLPKKYRIAQFFDEAFTTDLNGIEREIYPAWLGCGTIAESSINNSISGVAMAGNNPITSGKAILYGGKTTSKMYTALFESNIDNSGHFSFSNLTAKDFALKIIPDTSVYKNTIPTYHGNDFNWKNNIPISADTCSNGLNLAIQVDTLFPIISGAGKISGYLLYDGTGNKTSDPIPGIDVVLDKIPPSKSVNYTVTDTSGYYEFNNLPYGDYTIKIDFPGLKNDSLFFVSINNNYSYLPNLDYCVDTMKMTHVCGAFTSIQKIENKVGKSFTVYPNPFNNEINISTNKNNSLIQLYIFDYSGRLILSENEKSNGVISKDLSNLEAGIYFLNIIENHASETIKIVKN